MLLNKLTDGRWCGMPKGTFFRVQSDHVGVKTARTERGRRRLVNCACFFSGGYRCDTGDGFEKLLTYDSRGMQNGKLSRLHATLDIFSNGPGHGTVDCDCAWRHGVGKYNLEGQTKCASTRALGDPLSRVIHIGKCVNHTRVDMMASIIEIETGLVWKE